MGNKYAREMMLKIAIMEDVIQVKVLDLGEKYEQFVLDCYKGDEEAYEGGYIYDKIKNMNTDNKKIVVFVFKVDNPTYTIKDYVRRGYKAIIKEKNKKQSKSYASFLKELKEDNNERE